MKGKFFSFKFIILIIILFTCLFIFSTTSLALIPGDFGSAGGGPPDGVVDFEDLMIFAMAYGSTPADSNWNEVCDIAGLGSTIPDGVIDFEDLMVFAMNYGRSDKVHNLTKDTYYNTTQEALDDADSLGGDTIDVADGTYNESITFPTGKVVTLQSASGNRDNAIIQGTNGSATVTTNGSSTGTTLRGFTITHTDGDTGIGINNGNGNLIVDNCTISGNTATTFGGGICNFGSLTITGSNISGNNVSQQGGGIYLEGTGTITIGGSSSIDTDNFNTFTDNKKDGIISTDQHIRNFGGDCRIDYPYNNFDPE